MESLKGPRLTVPRRPDERAVYSIIISGLTLLVFWWQIHRGILHYYLDAVDGSTKQEHFRNPAYLVKAYNGAVASENELCSRMGVDVLRDGGNAVDAAISTTICVGVVNMFSSGLGGGGFMTVRIPPSGPGQASEAYTIDFRETAPALSNETIFKGRPLEACFGGLAVAVPGELRGLQEAHRRWGSLPWKRLIQPGVELAAGWRVQRELARRIELVSELFAYNPDWWPLFSPNGTLLKEGDWIHRTNLAKTLSSIAEQGADVFYEGPIADAIVSKVQQAGGILSHKDLLDYKVSVDRALEGTYRGRKVYTTHAPGAGPILLQMLNTFEKWAMESRTFLNVHRMVETMKFAFASRTRMADPAYTNDTARISRMSTKDYASEIFVNVTDDTTHPPEYYHPEFDVRPDHGTSHSSIVDSRGMAVSITSTINGVFGSYVLDPVTGVILNNEMNDFSIPGAPNIFGLWPSPYNYPEPGKRPVSSTAPTIIENPDGSLYVVIGGSGGSRIFGAVSQVLLNLEWGLDASAAVEFGRLHDQLYPLVLEADDVYPTDILNSLRMRSHNVSLADVNRIAAVVQTVVQRDGILYAASDSRKNGIAAGY